MPSECRAVQGSFPIADITPIGMTGGTILFEQRFAGLRLRLLRRSRLRCGCCCLGSRRFRRCLLPATSQDTYSAYQYCIC